MTMDEKRQSQGQSCFHGCSKYDLETVNEKSSSQTVPPVALDKINRDSDTDTDYHDTVDHYDEPGKVPIEPPDRDKDQDKRPVEPPVQYGHAKADYDPFLGCVDVQKCCAGRFKNKDPYSKLSGEAPYDGGPYPRPEAPYSCTGPRKIQLHEGAAAHSPRSPRSPGGRHRLGNHNSSPWSKDTKARREHKD